MRCPICLEPVHDDVDVCQECRDFVMGRTPSDLDRKCFKAAVQELREIDRLKDSFGETPVTLN